MDRDAKRRIKQTARQASKEGIAVTGQSQFCKQCNRLFEPDLEACPNCGGEEQTRQELVDYTIQRLVGGIPTNQIADELTNAGWGGAEPFVGELNNHLNTVTRKARAAHKKHMVYGLLWMIGGATVSLLTYLAASGGGVYFLFWGAVIWGAVDFVRGLAGWLNNR